LTYPSCCCLIVRSRVTLAAPHSLTSGPKLPKRPPR